MNKQKKWYDFMYEFNDFMFLEFRLHINKDARTCLFITVFKSEMLGSPLW